jgi:hypothetical protein
MTDLKILSIQLITCSKPRDLIVSWLIGIVISVINKFLSIVITRLTN